MNHEKKWYVIYSKSKLEKRTAETLEKKHIPVFLPECSTLQYMHGRQKIVKMPLLPSILFAFLNDQQLEKITNFNGVAGILYNLHKPAVIKTKEIESMQRFLAMYNDIIVEKVPINIGSEIGSLYSGNTDKLFLDIEYETEKLFLTSLGYRLIAKSSSILVTNIA